MNLRMRVKMDDDITALPPEAQTLPDDDNTDQLMDNSIGRAPPPATALVHPARVWETLKTHSK